MSGRVQGVWFRDSCRERARAERLAGYARNRADGRVEIELEGPQPAVDRVVAWCRTGPTRARVDAVDVEPVAPRGGAGFHVR